MKIVSLFLLVGLSVSVSQANTIILSSTSASKTFHAALNAAKDYDTIFIRQGIYTCINDSINKPLTIIGENFPALDGELKDEVLLVMSNNVNISGIEIRNSKRGSMKDFAGLRVFKSKHVTIENCILNNTYFGIYLSDSKHILVKNCKSKGANYGKSDTGNGIHLWKCDSVTIEGNHVEGHRDGIYFEFAKHCFIQNNFCEKNFRYGLHFMFSDNDTYENNTFTNNGTGVAVMYSKGVYMLNNKFENNWGDASYGLLLKTCPTELFLEILLRIIRLV